MNTFDDTCDHCFRETVHSRDEHDDLLCGECRDSKAYYDSLTPEELRAEQESMARYAQESDGL